MQHKLSLILILLLTPFFVGESLTAQTVDRGFYPIITNTTGGGAIRTSVVLPDGKILIGGGFSAANGFGRGGLVRLLPDGSVDPSFVVFGLLVVNDIAVQPDGKVVVAGGFSYINGELRRNIARLNDDGSLDTSFVPPDIGFSSSISSIELQPDGSVLAAGVYAQDKGVVRFKPDGSPDPTFAVSLSPGAYTNNGKLLVQKDGKIIVSYGLYQGGTHIARLARMFPDGEADQTFAQLDVSGTGSQSTGSEDIKAVLLQKDGKIIIGGSLSSVGGVARVGVARLNVDGTLDTSFAPEIDGPVHALFQEKSGSLLIAGAFTSVNGNEQGQIARLLTDGTLDTALNDRFDDGFASVNTVSLQEDGKIVAAGYFMNIGGVRRHNVARLDPTGAVDAGFAFVFVGSPGMPSIVQPRPDGKVFVAGQFHGVDGQVRNRLALLYADGTLDDSFRDVGLASNHTVREVIPLPDDKLILAGSIGATVPGTHWYRNLLRFNSDGSLDTTVSREFFENWGVTSLNSASLQPDGKILIGGHFTPPYSSTRRHLLRLNADLSVDDSYLRGLAGPNNGVSEMTLQPDGKVLIVGTFTEVSGVARNGIARMNPDGTLDESFQNGMAGIGSREGSIPHVVVMKVDLRGRILLGGEFLQINGVSRSYLARLNPDGSLDSAFLSGMMGPDSFVNGIEFETTGALIIGGSFKSFNGHPQHAFARVMEDGTLDSSYRLSFFSSTMVVSQLATDRHGNILVAGNFGRVNDLSRAGLLRVNGIKRSTPFDFDGDGRGDISLYRTTDKTWYINRSRDGYTLRAYGEATDKLIPADFDGDGKTDLAVWRPSDGNWYIIYSTTGAFVVRNFGVNGDVPVPTDFDGDGRADLGIYRPSEGVWYRLLSTNQYTVAQFGTAEDKPQIGDFDGDGKADLVVYRPSTGDWHVAPSGGGYFVLRWGLAGDISVPGDYNGDGKTDCAIFRPLTGEWWVLFTGTFGYTTINWGVKGDIPAPGDYDGDGKADPAVFRPSTGEWWLYKSAEGIATSNFGQNGDNPLASSFVNWNVH